MMAEVTTGGARRRRALARGNVGPKPSVAARPNTYNNKIYNKSQALPSTRARARARSLSLTDHLLTNITKIHVIDALLQHLRTILPQDLRGI